MTAMEWDELSRLIDGAGLAHVGTASASGDPHVAVVFAARENGRLLFTARSRSGKTSNLRVNPRISMMWQGNSAETYVWGTATLVSDVAEKARVWKSGILPFDLSQFYAAPDSDDWLVVHVAPERSVSMVQTAAGIERRTWRR